jgi:Mitochondrial K+-H+ exchange-related
VIPNLPFFFCVWRSWSHYRGTTTLHLLVSCPSYALFFLAYKASDYLQSLLQRGAIVPHSDADLDDIYTSLAPSNALPDSKKQTISEDKKDEEQNVLLRRDAVPQILQLYGLPESAATDIYRAVSQANARLREGIYK